MFKERSIRANFVLNIVRTIMNMLFPILTFSYASRIIGVDGIGKVNFVKSFIQVFIMISVLGITTYGIREGAKLRDSKEKLSQFTQEILIINIFSTVVGYSLLVLICCFVSRLHPYLPVIMIYSVSIVLNSCGMEWLYGALEDYWYITSKAIFVQFVALIIMFLFVRDKNDIYAYAVVCVLATCGSNIFNFIHCRKYISFKKFNYDFKRHVKPVLTLFSMTLSINLYTVLDTVTLGFLCGDRAVGIYSAGIKINRIVQGIITSLGTVIMPRLSYYIEKQENSKFMYLVENAYHFIFMMSIPICFGVFSLSKPIVLLLSGDEFETATVTSQLLSPIILLIPFSTLTNNQILIPMRKEKYVVESTCVGAIINFCTNMLLIPHLSENGAAMGTVVAESAVAIICFHNASRFYNVRDMFKGIFKYIISAVPIMIIGRIVGTMNMDSFSIIVMAVFICIPVYFSLLFILKDEFLMVILDEIKKIIKGRKNCL